jgi:hypothetical protein
MSKNTKTNKCLLLVLISCCSYGYNNAQTKNKCPDFIQDEFKTTTLCSIYTEEEVKTKFDRTAPNYHCYFVENKICNTKSDPYCSVSSIFNMLASSRQFIAPTVDALPVQNCCKAFLENDRTLTWESLKKCDRMDLIEKGAALMGKKYEESDPAIQRFLKTHIFTSIITWIYEHCKTKEIGTGHIINRIDYDNHIVNNYTYKDHMLRWGRVERRIVQRGDDIWIESHGEGNNIEPTCIPGILSESWTLEYISF